LGDSGFHPVLQETSDHLTYLSCEVTGDAQDPVTGRRAALGKLFLISAYANGCGWTLSETGAPFNQADGRLLRLIGIGRLARHTWGRAGLTPNADTHTLPHSCCVTHCSDYS
jgi:hypothetical protein